MKTKVAVGILAMSLAFFLLVGTASALSVTVAEDGENIIIEVSDNGAPVEGADVTVRGATEETPLDGEYTTDRDGRVVFDGDEVSEITGIVHLRISVEAGGSFRSTLSTLTRSPDVGASPLGHRMSVALHENAESTKGTVEGRMYSSEANSPEIREAAEAVDETLQRVGDARFEREVVERDLAAGDITRNEFYVEAVRNSGRSAYLRTALGETVAYLRQHSDEELTRNGVDTGELEAVHTELIEDSVLDTDRRILLPDSDG